MNNFKNYLVACGGIFALIGAIALVTPSTATGQGNRPTENVNVVNTPNVNVVNTPHVNVANTPTVNAQQQGAWTVGLSGTPGVNVINSPTVQVGNAASSPVPVRDVDNPTRQPFHGAGYVHLDGEQAVTLNVATVPVGKRLVIEFVSARVALTPGPKPSLQIRTFHDDFAQPHFLPTSTLGTYGETDEVGGTSSVFEAGTQTRLYANPGTPVEALVGCDDVVSRGAVTVTISGYLVDVP